MSSVYGDKVKISIFGESHGPGIGVVLDGIPAGIKLNMDSILLNMNRRAPGRDKTATPRNEADTPNIISGLLNQVTTGAPICCIINNTNTRPGDYENLLTKPRPGHADFTGYIRYNGYNDVRGGGHFSGRLTAPMVFAGSICRQILAMDGIKIASHIYSINNVYDTPFNPIDIEDKLITKLNQESFPVINRESKLKMYDIIENARLSQDSVGGIIECCAVGVKPGLGNPMFSGVENIISSIIFGVPAVKGLEFGAGFDITKMYGSQSNDQFSYDQNGRVITLSNNNGGILGGITTGMPILFRAAIKPTASISQIQNTVDLQTKKNTTLKINGRHDPCIASRASVVIESALALALINL